MGKRRMGIGMRYGVFLGLCATLWISGCGRPPQVVNNEECFTAVEALWTAVTSKRTDLLEQSAEELQRLHRAGKLLDDGHAELDRIVQMARKSKWRPAAEELHEFMLGQRKAR